MHTRVAASARLTPKTKHRPTTRDALLIGIWSSRFSADERNASAERASAASGWKTGGIQQKEFLERAAIPVVSRLNIYSLYNETVQRQVLGRHTRMVRKLVPAGPW